MAIDNDLVGPQIGLEARRSFCEGLFEFELLGKGGYFANFIGNRVTLQRGDTILGLDYEKNEMLGSGVFEGRLGMNFVPYPGIRLMGGWEYLWLIGVGTATGNLNFDLDRQVRPNNKDSVLFHGWYGGLEVTF